MNPCSSHPEMCCKKCISCILSVLVVCDGIINLYFLLLCIFSSTTKENRLHMHCSISLGMWPVCGVTQISDAWTHLLSFVEQHSYPLALYLCLCSNGYFLGISAFSALMLLVGRQEGHPACKKTEWWGAGVVICLNQGADLHMAQLMPLRLSVSCFSEVQIGFTFLVLAHPGSPGQRAVKRVFVCVFLHEFSSFSAACCGSECCRLFYQTRQMSWY